MDGQLPSGILTVMLVEDQPLTIDYLRELIDWNALGFRIVATAGNGREALGLLDVHRPDIVFVDVVMPVLDGIEFTKQARRSRPGCQIVVLSAYRQFEYVKEAMSHGAMGYILKHELTAVTLTATLKHARRNIEAYYFEIGVRLRAMVAAIRDGDTDARAQPNAFLDQVLAEGDMWILAVGPRRAEQRLNPSFPETLHDFEKRFAVEIDRRMFLAAYRPRHPHGEPEIADILQDLRDHHRRTGDAASRSYVYVVRCPDRRSGPRRELATAIADLLAVRPQLPPYYVAALDEIHVLTGDGATAPDDDDRSIVERAHAYIRRHYALPVGTSDVARAIGVNSAYLCQCFRAESSTTVLQEIIALRLERAKRLLEEGNAPVSEVSAACGFASPRYFSQVFRRAVGCTPTRFRARTKREQT